MRKSLIVAACLTAMAAAWIGGARPARAAGTPVITSLSASTLPRSGRLLINGSGFSATQGGSQVSIGGLAAPVTRWSDTLIGA